MKKSLFTDSIGIPCLQFNGIKSARIRFLVIPFLLLVFIQNLALAQPEFCELECPDVCGVDTNPNLQVNDECTFFSLDLGQLIESSVTGPTSLGCNEEEVVITAEMDFGGIATEDIGGATVGSLLGGPLCTLLEGISVGPFGFRSFNVVPEIQIIPRLLPDGVECSSTLPELFLGILRMQTGQSGGLLLVADTDGDGAFDVVLEEGEDPILQSGSYTVPINLDGTGCITVRAVNAFPSAPANACGVLQNEISLLELIGPIFDAIPIGGPIIGALLAQNGCDANLAFSSSSDHIIEVTNNEPPVFLNCPTNDYVFADDGSCTDPVNWSIPIAIDNCTGQTLVFMGVGAVGTGPGVWQTAGPEVGSNLGVGVYPVTYTAQGCENTTECTFNIIVQDNNPLLVCPSDMTISTDSDICTKTIKGLIPLSGQSCVSTITYGVEGATTVPAGIDFTDLQNGVVFNPGTSTVTYNMTVDLNNDGDLDDTIDGVSEMQECSFDITVEDDERPFAICTDIDVQLDETGQVRIFASDQVASYVAGSPVIDGGSMDNCTPREELIIRINDEESLVFDCDDVGPNYVTLSVYDLNHNPDGTRTTGARNIRTCIAQINIVDYFDNYVVELDVPEVCFENGPQTIDLTEYLTIRTGEGTLLTHADVLADPTLLGEFTIPAGAPLNNGLVGSLTPDGVYDVSESSATGNFIFEYTLSLASNASCDVKGRSTFELRQPMDVNEAVCHCLNEDNYREINLGDFLGNTNGLGEFFPHGQAPYTIQYSGGVLTSGDGNTILDPNQNGTIIYDYAYAPGTTVDINGIYWGSGNILDDDSTPNDLLDNPVVAPLLAPQNLTGDGSGVFNLGSLVPVDPGADGVIGTNDDVQLDGNWSFTIVDARGCEIFRSGSCAPLLTEIEGPSGPVCITDPVLTYFDLRTNSNPSNGPFGIPACETVAGGAVSDITWELSTTLRDGSIFTVDMATIPGGVYPAGFTDVMPNNTPNSILTVFNNGVVELNPINLKNTAFTNGGDFVLRMYVDRHACFDPDNTDNDASACLEVFETSIIILPEFDPTFTTPNEPICVELIDDATTDDGDAFNHFDNESLVTLCLEDYANIISVFNDMEPILDASGQIIEENVYITWSGPGITDLNDGTVRDNDGTNTATDGPGRVNGAFNPSTGCATFDPSVAGVGTHTINVEVGYDNCRRTFSQTIVVKPIEPADLRDDYGVCSSNLGQINLTVLFSNAAHGGDFSLINAYSFGNNTVDNLGLNNGTYVLDDIDLTQDNNGNGIQDVSIGGDVLQYESDIQLPLSAAEAPIEVCLAYGVGCDFSLLGADHIPGNADDYTGIEIVTSLSAAAAPPPAGNYEVVATPTKAAPIFTDQDGDGYISVAEVVAQFTATNPVADPYDAPTQVADIQLILEAMQLARPCFSFDITCFTINNGHDAALDLPEEIYCIRGQDSLVQLYRYTSIEDVNLSALIVEEQDGNLDPGEIQFILASVNGQTYLSPTTIPQGFPLGTPGLPSAFTIDSDNDGVYTPGVDLDMATIISTANCDANNQFGPIDPTAPSSQFCPMLDFGVLNSLSEPVNVKIRMQYNDSECLTLAEDTLLKLYEIPTMSQWGLLLFALLLFNLRLIFAYRQKMMLQGAANISINVVPFDKRNFVKYFGIIFLILVFIFLLSIYLFGYELMPFDIPGSLLTASLMAYLIQLINHK